MAAETHHGMGRPVGQNMVAGFLRDGEGNKYWIDYNRGAISTNGASAFPSMPEKILLN